MMVRLLVCAVLLLSPLAHAQSLPDCRALAMSERAAPQRGPGAREPDPMVGTVRWTLTLAIRGWQLLASPANGSSCAFYPTCSGYGLQAVKRNGPVLGAIMAAERINRNHDGWRYTPCEVNGRTYLYDPVSDNDFWMRRRRGGRR